MIRPGLTSRSGSPFFRGMLFSLGMLTTAILAGILTFRVVMPSDEVEVPNLLAQESITAWESLQRVGLVPHLENRKYHPNLPSGCVISQSPLPGVTVRKGRTVRITISEGFELLPMPDLSDMTIHKAEVAARSQGFELTSSASMPSNTVLSGRVISQSPSPNIQAPRGTLIRIVASEGPRMPAIIMPDILGKPLPEGRRLLESLRTEKIRINEVSVSHHPPGTIVSQSPAPLSIVSLGSEVSISVSAGASPVSDLRVGLGWARILPNPLDAFSIYRLLIQDELGKDPVVSGWLCMGEEVNHIYVYVGHGRATIFLDSRIIQEWLL